MTLIQLIRAMPDPAVSASPGVPGDEFALRGEPSPGTSLPPQVVETRQTFLRPASALALRLPRSPR